jgi:hypothetical protein
LVPNPVYSPVSALHHRFIVTLSSRQENGSGWRESIPLRLWHNHSTRRLYHSKLSAANQCRVVRAGRGGHHRDHQVYVLRHDNRFRGGRLCRSQKIVSFVDELELVEASFLRTGAFSAGRLTLVDSVNPNQARQCFNVPTVIMFSYYWRSISNGAVQSSLVASSHTSSVSRNCA